MQKTASSGVNMSITIRESKPIQAIIPANGTTSNTVACPEAAFGGVQVPSGMTGDQITFLVSCDLPTTSAGNRTFMPLKRLYDSFAVRSVRGSELPRAWTCRLFRLVGRAAATRRKAMWRFLKKRPLWGALSSRFARSQVEPRHRLRVIVGHTNQRCCCRSFSPRLSAGLAWPSIKDFDPHGHLV
jgi:hypothetical protein